MTRRLLPRLDDTAWRKSSHSNQAGGNCIEVADGIPGGVPVRDSKVPNGPALCFGDGAWTAFVGGLRGGLGRF